ncbi:MAG: hypothetical protein K0U59_08800 [Gammaproteobacteria bacterium]|nr:hypothetical protein [Gammaproteobacteria bacterium]
MLNHPRLTRFYEQAPNWLFILIAGLAALSTYFSMYAFRKPFAAATYSDVSAWAFFLDYKTTLVIAQVVGYAISKLAGIKIIAEMPPAKRASALLLMIAIAQLALLLFALVPRPWNIAALWLNGLPLGLVWGLVFGFLEGRRVSEALGVILSVSLIFSSGAVKSVGRYLLLEWQVDDHWMPFLTGLIFSPLLIISVALLSAIPKPNRNDELQRQQRITMNRVQRRQFFASYAPGLVALVLAYVLLTALRDFTDNYAVNLFEALGYGDSSAVYTTTTLPVIAVVLLFLGGLMFVKRNLMALQLNLSLVALGFALLAGSTICYQQALISGLSWFMLMQTGLYMSYIPFNCVLFDRIVAATPKLANAGFLIYIADACGYLGSISILLIKNLAKIELPWLEFTINVSYFAGIVGCALTLVSMLYFQRRLAPYGQPLPASQPS